jgi:hypothetical protein
MPHPPKVEAPAGLVVRARDRDDPSLDRIAAFSGGVFAFAITLPILAIRIPRIGSRPTDRAGGEPMPGVRTPSSPRSATPRHGESDSPTVIGSAGGKSATDPTQRRQSVVCSVCDK